MMRLRMYVYVYVTLYVYGVFVTKVNGESTAAPPTACVNIVKADGNVSYTGLGVNDNASLFCNQGYTLSGNNMSTCLIDFSWNPDLGSCEIITDYCPENANIGNGTVTVTDRHLGSEATIMCNAGFEFDTPSNATCHSDSSWLITALCVKIDECLPNPCTNGGNCVNAVNSYTCMCQPGYTGVFCENNIDECGSSPCQNNGTCVDDIDRFTCTCPHPYNGDICDTIIASVCAQLPHVENGGITVPTVIEVGSIATYSCNEGYNLQGHTSRTCGNSGAWSHSEPECVDVPNSTLLYIVFGVCLGVETTVIVVLVVILCYRRRQKVTNANRTRAVQDRKAQHSTRHTAPRKTVLNKTQPRENGWVHDQTAPSGGQRSTLLF